MAQAPALRIVQRRRYVTTDAWEFACGIIRWIEASGLGFLPAALKRLDEQNQ
jgi:hypothetical protein